METILTDAKGRPIPKPTIPPVDADLETQLAYIQARHEWADRVNDVANAAFAKGLIV